MEKQIDLICFDKGRIVFYYNDFTWESIKLNVFEKEKLFYLLDDFCLNHRIFRKKGKLSKNVIRIKKGM